MFTRVKQIHKKLIQCQKKNVRKRVQIIRTFDAVTATSPLFYQLLAEGKKKKKQEHEQDLLDSVVALIVSPVFSPFGSVDNPRSGVKCLCNNLPLGNLH